MSLPSAEEITNLYLYGQTGLPSDRLAASLVRPTAITTKLQVNEYDYVTVGAGRFANPSRFEVI